jgi:hypothetical protein
MGLARAEMQTAVTHLRRVGRWCSMDDHACQRCLVRHGLLRLADGPAVTAVEELTQRVLVSGLLLDREDDYELIGGDDQHNLLGLDPICSPP